jgi:hypothetical protein
MHAAISGLCTFAGFIVALVMLCLFLASMPNSSPSQLARLNGLMLSLVLVMLFGLVGGVWGTITGRGLIGSLMGVLPGVYAVVLFIVLLAVGG